MTKITLKQYIAQLQTLSEKYPNAKLVYAKDDEGNAFSEVSFAPTAGRFDDGEFHTDELNDKLINAVCLN